MTESNSLSLQRSRGPKGRWHACYCQSILCLESAFRQKQEKTHTHTHTHAHTHSDPYTHAHTHLALCLCKFSPGDVLLRRGKSSSQIKTVYLFQVHNMIF